MTTVSAFLESFIEENQNQKDILEAFKNKYPTVNDIFDALDLDSIDFKIEYDFSVNEDIIRVLAMQKPAVLAINSYPKGICMWVDDEIQFPDMQSKKQFVNGFLRTGYLVAELIRNIWLIKGGDEYENSTNK